MNKVWDSLPPDLRLNPFFHYSAAGNYVPAWDRIELHHVLPAFDFAFADASKKIKKITNSRAAPTFKNTVEALEQVFELPGYFLGVFFNFQVGTGPAEDEYDRIMQQVLRRYNGIFNDVFRENKELHRRFIAVRQDPSYKNLTSEQKRLFEMYKNAFHDQGLSRSAETKEKLIALEEKIHPLEMKSQKNMKLAERSYNLVVADATRLKGLSQFAMASAAKQAADAGQPGKYLFSLERDVYESFMQTVEDRALRQEFWQAYSTQASHGPYDNRATILELVDLQQQYAQTLGYKDHATLSLTYNMALTPQRVAHFLTGLRDKAFPVAQKEIRAMKKYALKKDGVTLEPWDVFYYEDRMKKDILGFSAQELRPYFELENVLAGSFDHFKKLLGLRFEENNAYPVHHPDVRAFDVFEDKTGKKMGVLFMDLYARDGKGAGTAWQCTVFTQGLFEGKVRRPVDMIVTKFTRGSNGEPALLTHFDVLVLFHELGHATHDLVSKCRYPSLAGTNVEGDFVEFPSQIQENWTFQPEVLDKLGRHYKTGAPLPDDLKEKIQQSRKFMAGIRILDYAMRGLLDLGWYRSKPGGISNVEDFERGITQPYNLLPTYNALLSPRFSHLFGGGYEANFYSYQWSEIMEADVFDAFAKKGIYNPETAAAYRKIPEQGGSNYGGDMFKQFRGRAPLQTSFLQRAGLLGKTFNYAAALKTPKLSNDNIAAKPQKLKAPTP